MKNLIIKLSEEDIESIEIVLPMVAKAIEEGFHGGIEYPVNWSLQDREKLDQTYQKKEIYQDFFRRTRRLLQKVDDGLDTTSHKELKSLIDNTLLQI
tara:strand:- start:27642 stop:27932 length:291 start_codon:yes stop_codon:yes gene_type:complete